MMVDFSMGSMVSAFGTLREISNGIILPHQHRHAALAHCVRLSRSKSRVAIKATVLHTNLNSAPTVVGALFLAVFKHFSRI